MANFARVDNGVVSQVIVISNQDILDEENVESEAVGQAFIQSLGLDGQWVQTSYNGNPVDGHDRGPFAGIGYQWTGEVFIPFIEETPIEETP